MTPTLPTIKFAIPAWIKHWYSLMTNREKIAIGLLGAVFIISIIFTLTSFIDNHSHLIPEFGGTYREGAVGQPRYINPILSSANDLDADITNLVYSSLFKLDNNFQLQKDIATDYTISSDQKTYTINLRHDVRWQDGQPLTADDIIFTIRSIQTPDYGSPLASSFQGVQVTKDGDYTVIFTLKNPYAPFLNNLTVGIVPAHVWQNIDPKNAALAEQMLKPIGSGPFKFADITTRRQTGAITTYDLVRNESYYGPRPYLDKISFSFYDNQDDATTALTTGHVDGLSFLPLSSIDTIQNHRGLTIDHLLLPEYFGLFFNQENNNALGDAAVRAALELATDRSTIVKDALNDEGQPLAIPITPGYFTFPNSTLGDYDPTKARATLDNAGWKVGDNGIRSKNGTTLSLHITTTDWPEYVKTAQAIQQQWRAVGVDVQIDQVGAGTIQQSVVAPRNYQVLLYGEILPAEPDPYPFWHSTQIHSPGLNLSLLQDQQIDQLLEAARSIMDTSAQQDKYSQFIARFAQLHPAVILYQPYYLFAHSTILGGNTLRNINLPAGRFNDISNWFVNTKRVWGAQS